MNKINTIREAMVEAMKAKGKARKDSLSMLLNALKNTGIDRHSPLTEEEKSAIVKKEIKQCRETFNTTPTDREDIKEEATSRIAIYKEFAPEDISVEQTKKVIAGVLAEPSIETPTPADKGRIMKVLVPKVKGKADSRMVSETLAAMSK